MKGFLSYLVLALLLAVMLIAPRAGAQAFGLSVVPSVNSVLVSNAVTYTINVTNLTDLVLNDVWITNLFSASFQYITASSSQLGTTVTNTATNVLFDLGPVDIGVIVQVNLTVEPTTTGNLTDAVTVAVPATTYAVTTNTVVQVTNVTIQADLGVTMTGPSQVVITNDWITYGVTVTNAGPDDAPNVILTNTLPSGVIPISLTNQINGSNFIYNLGTVTNSGFTNLFFTVEPTNAATLTFSASVGSSSVTDTNTANNFASTNITVTSYLPGVLVAVTNSAQNPDFVSGLMEQSVLISNTGTNDVPAARLVFTGLTNRLYNAVGTNGGNPFVYYSAKIMAGQSASLLLQFYPNNFFSLTNNQLNAYAVPAPNWTPPVVTATSTNLNISRIVQLNNGWMLVEFPTVAGQAYTVVYSSDISFSNAMIAPPSIVAGANWTQWIDYGPPATVAAPTNASARFYRVFQNP